MYDVMGVVGVDRCIKDVHVMSSGKSSSPVIPSSQPNNNDGTVIPSSQRDNETTMTRKRRAG